MLRCALRGVGVRPQEGVCATEAEGARVVIDVVASEPHFVDHTLPVYEALPEESRGRFYVGKGKPANRLAAQHVRDAGYQPTIGHPPSGSAGLTLVAAVGDLVAVNRMSPRRRFAYMEHGCGISYGGHRASYIGGKKRPACEVIFTPNEWTAEKQREATPWIEVLSLGSSPRLDRWVNDPPGRLDPPRVVVSFHADMANVCPEAGTALPFYAKHLHRLVGGPWEVVGHAHPRACLTGAPQAVYRRAGIPFVDSFEDVLATGSVYLCDNSSSIYEMAATGRPVVALNCPQYRRKVSHGLRFWDHIPGLQCDSPDDLSTVVLRALEDPPDARQLREDAIRHVYPQNDGRSAQRAAGKLVEVASGLSTDPAPVARVTPMFEVRDSGGEQVKRWRTEYEARTHARKLGGTYEVVAG